MDMSVLSAVSITEWCVLVGSMLFGSAAHYMKKFSEAEVNHTDFSARSYLLNHKWAVLSSLMMQFAGLIYLIEQSQAGVFSAVLLGISAESASGWVRSKSKFKE